MLTPLPGHSELLSLHPLPCPWLLWCPGMAESCPNTVRTKGDTFCADFYPLERDMSVELEAIIPRIWQNSARQKEEIIGE